MSERVEKEGEDAWVRGSEREDEKRVSVGTSK